MSNEQIRFLEQILQLIGIHGEVSEVTWKESEHIKVTKSMNFISSSSSRSFSGTLRSEAEDHWAC